MPELTAVEKFATQLEGMGFTVKRYGDQRVSFPYKIESGKFADQEITVGFVVPPDFPASPPTGPHISPRLLPVQTASGPHPAYGIHEGREGFTGEEWEYWSRPMHHWPKSTKDVRAVMSHLRRLFDTQ